MILEGDSGDLGATAQAATLSPAPSQRDLAAGFGYGLER